MPWTRLVPLYIHGQSKHFSDILVPTIDTMRTTWFVNLMNELNRPVVLVGETGTSKTAIIQDFLRSLNQDKFVRKKLYYLSCPIFQTIFSKFPLKITEPEQNQKPH